ncbi:hypothetical protein HanIR_Chr14g0719701 [Helianthus annuus]|nr:hypothetical protein HanIR_Chr14g0719701 [Helianthus annuus]
MVMMVSCIHDNNNNNKNISKAYFEHQNSSHWYFQKTPTLCSSLKQNPHSMTQLPLPLVFS